MTNEPSSARRLGPPARLPDSTALSEFASLISQETNRSTCTGADRVEQNVPIYDCNVLVDRLVETNFRQQLTNEWGALLLSGPGVFVLQHAFPDTSIVDRATKAFLEIIDQQNVTEQSGGDHFAKAGANERIWNALEKFCIRDPEAFALYYANQFIALASEAWLGPSYQVTSQVNVVNPGGDAQQAHRDYHLGFQTDEQSAKYPAHAQRLSAALTLQGAVAHVDMTVASGATRLLPFSQIYDDGYLTWRRPEFQDIFQANYVQLPLSKGDAVFFSPALFHAAGPNTTSNVARMANLLQISSSFGRAMESVDRRRMCSAVYATLNQLVDSRVLDQGARDNVIAASAEGYSFPTNLDRDPPVDGLAPQTQQALMREACDNRWNQQKFEQALDAQLRRR